MSKSLNALQKISEVNLEIPDENEENSVINSLKEKYGTESDLDEQIEKILQEQDEEIEEVKVSHRDTWNELIDTFNKERQAVADYNKSKLNVLDIPTNPAIEYLNNEVFPTLLTSLEETLRKAKEMDCLKNQKSTFNGIDYMAETLWITNPHHPERLTNKKNIFSLEWVQDFLQLNPRPYYPFSYIWSKEYAATKIQAGVRGYWVRRNDDVQEMRQFWKALYKEKQEV